jgi:hypothetical protein
MAMSCLTSISGAIIISAKQLSTNDFASAPPLSQDVIGVRISKSGQPVNIAWRRASMHFD